MNELTPAELRDIASVLERSLQRAQRKLADAAHTVEDEQHERMLAREVARINEEIGR